MGTWYLQVQFNILQSKRLNLYIQLVFSFRGFNWFWIYLVGPHVGAILGVGVYHLFLKTNESAERRVRFKNEKEEEPQWWERSNIEFAPQKNLQSLNPYVFREYPLNIDEHF